MRNKIEDELVELMMLAHQILREMQNEWLTKQERNRLRRELNLVNEKRVEVLEKNS